MLSALKQAQATAALKRLLSLAQGTARNGILPAQRHAGAVFAASVAHELAMMESSGHSDHDRKVKA